MVSTVAMKAFKLTLAAVFLVLLAASYLVWPLDLRAVPGKTTPTPRPRLWRPRPAGGWSVKTVTLSTPDGTPWPVLRNLSWANGRPEVVTDLAVATEQRTNVTVDRSGPKLGFIMGMHYSDQMTGASANLMNLQCFAGRHLKDVKVVEPFLHLGSTLGVSLSPSFTKLEPQNMNTVKHSDVFDSEEWAQIASSQNYAPLVSWNEFMRVCPKKLILVFHVYTSGTAKGCDHYMTNATREFVVDNKFEVVKQVCLDFEKLGILSPQTFINEIYGKFKPNEVVVIFNRWGGFSIYVEHFMLSVKDTPCVRGLEKRLYHHSKQLLSDVKEYSTKYLDASKQHLAVMVRTEFYINRNHLFKLSADAQRTKFTSCFNEIFQKATAMKKERNLTNTLLTIDIGKYGSVLFRKDREWFSRVVDERVLNETVSKFLGNLMGESFSQSEWEDSYTNVAQLKVPGYIASMQLELAARSVCLLQAGGGTFQQSALRLYKELHPQSLCTASVCM